MTVVTFGGLTFDDNATSGFTLARLQGWYGGAPSRRTLRDRPQADGAFGSARYYRGARVVSVEGSYIGSSIADAYAARDTLAALQANGLSSSFAVTDQLGTRTATVELVSAPDPDDGLFSPFFTFAFDVVASDPRKYGATLAPFTGLPTAGTGYVWPAVWPADWGSGGDPGRVSATNTGTAETSPVLEVIGGLTGGVELVEVVTGSVLRLERDIPATGTVFFDTRTSRVYLDAPANDINSFLTRREWSGFTIPAGATRTVQFNALGATSGTPRLTVRYAPAY